MKKDTQKTGMAELTDTQILHGGEKVSVQKRDGSNDTLFVRQIKPREVDRYLEIEADEVALVEWLTDLDSDDADELTLDSFTAVLEAVHRQNFSFVRSREKRLAEQAARTLDQLRETNPDLYKRAVSAQEKAVDSLTSSLGQLPAGSDGEMQEII